MTSNEERSERGFRTLVVFMQKHPDYCDNSTLTQEVLTDLFTDLRHTLEDYNIDFNTAVRLSEIHFEAEMEEEDLI